MPYSVYTVEYLGEPNHVALYVEKEPVSDSNKKGSGTLYHVTGSILVGMKYENKPSYNFKQSVSFIPGSNVLIGRVKATDMPLLEAVCETVPPPGAQITKRGGRMDSSKPLRRCGEWVKDVVEKLLADGVVNKELG